MRAPEPPPGYLGHVLRDGARPYLYRGRLRRLLGLPEGGPEVAYAAATAPPVGFRYLELPWLPEGSPVRGLGAAATESSPPGAATDAPPAMPVAESRRVEVPGVSEVKRLFPALKVGGDHVILPLSFILPLWGGALCARRRRFLRRGGGFQHDGLAAQQFLHPRVALDL